ncbi:MAG: RNA methyltransferase [Turneriella sp.]|nr:RNA methyltransferase [Turneriella sp.]
MGTETDIPKSSNLTPRRYERIMRVLASRTRRITVLLEDIYDPLNASAVLRTCDGLGIQDIHIAENRHAFSVHDKVAGRAAKWLTIHRYRPAAGLQKSDFRVRPTGIPEATVKAYTELRRSGYVLLATSPRGQFHDLLQLDIRQKYAVVLGSEHWGLSDWAMENADLIFALPILGFTESYNISATAAMILYTLCERLRRETQDWQLEEVEKEELWRLWSAPKSQRKQGAATPPH